MMKILYVGVFDPYLTGGTRRSYEVAQRLKKFGMKASVLDLRFMKTGGFLTKIGAFGCFSSILQGRKTESRLNREDFDLIVSTESAASAILGHYLGKRFKIPWTLVMQLPIRLRYVPSSATPIFIDPFWLPLTLNVSAVMRKTIPLVYSESVLIDSWTRAKNYILMKPGIGLDLPEIRRVPESEKIFDAAFVARLVPGKGILDIPRIWKPIVKIHPDARIAVMGKFQSDKVKQKFESIVRRLELTKNVLLLGYVSDERKYSVLKSSKIFIYPSKLDCFSIALLEALACGLPAITYDIPAFRLNFPLTSVFKVPSGNIKAFAEVTIDLLKHNDLTKLASDAKAFSSAFTWDRVVKAEINAYKQFLNISQTIKAS